MYIFISEKSLLIFWLPTLSVQNRLLTIFLTIVLKNKTNGPCLFVMFKNKKKPNLCLYNTNKIYL